MLSKAYRAAGTGLPMNATGAVHPPLTHPKPVNPLLAQPGTRNLAASLAFFCCHVVLMHVGLGHVPPTELNVRACS